MALFPDTIRLELRSSQEKWRRERENRIQIGWGIYCDPRKSLTGWDRIWNSCHKTSRIAVQEDEFPSRFNKPLQPAPISPSAHCNKIRILCDSVSHLFIALYISQNILRAEQCHPQWLNGWLAGWLAYLLVWWRCRDRVGSENIRRLAWSSISTPFNLFLLWYLRKVY